MTGGLIGDHKLYENNSVLASPYKKQNSLKINDLSAREIIRQLKEALGAKQDKPSEESKSDYQTLESPRNISNSKESPSDPANAK